MTPPEQDWFKQYLEEKFSHLETKINTVEDISTETLDQAKRTNGRVNDLYAWKSKTEGIWYGLNKMALFLGAIMGIALNIAWDWFKTIKLGQ